jgi:cysteinyl-tRNA synthetase
MGLKLYNTLTRTKQDFDPIDPANVRMYVCGPTVYDFAHIGNARPLIVFDVLFRLLRHLYGPEHVTYVRNITDVDDKINARAAEEFPDLPLNEAIRKVTERTEKQFHEDVDALGCLRPTVEPRATEYIRRPDAPEDMIRLIGRLVENGHAYPAEGHVLFDVKSWRGADGALEYGKLSNRSLDDMIAGARVEVAPYKKDPMDFVLWKPSKPGEPSWPSPWGEGRPGWHIECSAMAGALLGETFDIHGGGIDLVFPHHENEIAQSRCAHGTAVMANYWLHNGFLQVEGEKMSKSLGNFVTIRELLDRWPGDVLRLQMIMTHYRQPIDWTVDRSRLTALELSSWASLLAGWWHLPPVPPSDKVVQALQDDLNTPEALAVLRGLFREAKDGPVEKIMEFAASCRILGFKELGMASAFTPVIEGENTGGRTEEFRDEVTRLRAAIANNAPASVRERIVKEIRGRGLDVRINETLGEVMLVGQDRQFSAKINAQITARAAARKAKNFAEADRIRAELDAMGVALKDAKDPQTGELVTTWEVKR